MKDVEKIKNHFDKYKNELNAKYDNKQIGEDTYKVACELLDSLYKDIVGVEVEDKNESEYVFEFEYSNDPRKGVPYVARLKWNNEKNELDREFFDFSKEYSRHSVTVWGTYKAKELDILEIRTGGSWSNDYRDFHIVKDGKLEKLGDACSSKMKMKIKKYLKGMAELDSLFE